VSAETLGGRLHDLGLRVRCEGPAIRRCAEDFLAALAGSQEAAPLDVLEFSLEPLEGARDHPTPGGGPTPIQFASVACVRDGPRLHCRTRDGSFIEADVKAGRGWGRLSADVAGPGRHLFADLLLAPLMEMLKRRGLYGLHAAALVQDGVGYLFPGDAGSGKTTLALGLVRAGFRYLADDKLLLRRDGAGIAALAFTRRFNVDPDIAGRYPELGFLRDRTPLPFTTKRPVDLSRVYADTFIPACAPGVVVHLRRRPAGESRLHRLSPTDYFGRHVHHTIHAPHRDTAARQLRLFAALAETAEHYLLDNGPDLYGAPARLVELLPRR
jgi:hypothetical protein